MRYQVPQFIEVEDKIFGPLTFKQFIYVAGGVGACVLLFTFLPNFLALLLSAPIAALAGALAFYKHNGKPFINLLESFFQYSLTNKLYIWKKANPPPGQGRSSNQQPVQPLEQIKVPKLSESKLKDLSWSLDIKDTSNPTIQTSNDEI
jgi:hypothetical protein